MPVQPFFGREVFGAALTHIPLGRNLFFVLHFAVVRVIAVRFETLNTKRAKDFSWAVGISILKVSVVIWRKKHIALVAKFPLPLYVVVVCFVCVH